MSVLYSMLRRNRTRLLSVLSTTGKLVRDKTDSFKELEEKYD